MRRAVAKREKPPEPTPSLAEATPPPFDMRFAIINKIGMVDSLSAGVATRLLETLSLPAPLFGLLHLFVESPETPRTVTVLAKMMRVPQPGVTKRVQKLLQRGLVREEASPFDARQKLLFITPAGQELHRQAIRLLVPAAWELFAGWSDAELRQMMANLERIKAALEERF